MASTSTTRYLTMEELNKTALEQFVYQPVGRDMIAYLAQAAHNVIACDPTLMPPAPAEPRHNIPTPPRSPEPRTVRSEDGALPSLEEFITQLVVSSNVQVPTLMSTLVYLGRLKSKLQPMARGLRCTAHRIFLAALILSAKYLNDSSPKNKHWANYSHITTEGYNFGFSRTEVNLMEKQLLFLLEWDLGISANDLYRDLDDFLEPLRHKIAERHAWKMRHREERRQQKEIYAASARYNSPASSHRQPRSRGSTPEHTRNLSASGTPPGLSYSSSSSSYASSVSSGRAYSQVTTPLETSEHEPQYYESQQGSLYDSPVQIVPDVDYPKAHMPSSRMLPYEITADEYQQYQQLHETSSKKQHHQQQQRSRRGMWGRLLGGSVAVR
ncbi:cyclin [Fusarium heterosporum]|uniref:Cyclin n=1 Tax=Fusarium heterosporum TaxID=42747 RepID=A0A8H5U602_FUSHE|nr:cyclin [Fusarium heterosporum]